MITCLFDETSNCVTLRASGPVGFLRAAHALLWAVERSPAADGALLVLENDAAVRSALELRALDPVLLAWRERHPDLRVAVVAPSAALPALQSARQLIPRLFEGVVCFDDETPALAFLAPREFAATNPMANAI